MITSWTLGIIACRSTSSALPSSQTLGSGSCFRFSLSQSSIRFFSSTSSRPPLLSSLPLTSPNRSSTSYFSSQSDSSAADVSFRTQMKNFEVPWSPNLPSHQPFIIRLDGCGFSGLTKHFQKPWDSRIGVSMLQTTIDLFEKFSCAAAYTGSDEISLVFDKSPLEGGVLYAGSLPKLVSISASWASVRFNHYLGLQHFDLSKEKETKAHSRATEGKIIFDSRVFSLPSAEWCLANIEWRVEDCKRNSKYSLGRAHFRHSELQGIPSGTVAKMAERYGVTWTDQPSWYRSGVLVKKRLVEREGIHIPTNKSIVTLRKFSHVAPALEFSNVPKDQMARFLLSKYTNDDPELSCKMKPLSDYITPLNYPGAVISLPKEDDIHSSTVDVTATTTTTPPQH